MMQLKSRNHVPPGSFAFMDPDTRHVSTGPKFGICCARVNEHRVGNGLPPFSEEQIDTGICAGLSLEARTIFCRDADLSTPQTIGLTLADILRGTMTVAAFKLSGSSVVEQPEAERRAAICAQCPMNVKYRSACGMNCAELTDAVKAIVGGATTSKDAELDGCACCKCSLKAKVWLPLDSLRRFESEELQLAYPGNCWLAREPAPA